MSRPQNPEDHNRFDQMIEGYQWPTLVEPSLGKPYTLTSIESERLQLLDAYRNHQIDVHIKFPVETDMLRLWRTNIIAQRTLATARTIGCFNTNQEIQISGETVAYQIDNGEVDWPILSIRPPRVAQGFIKSIGPCPVPTNKWMDAMAEYEKLNHDEDDTKLPTLETAETPGLAIGIASLQLIERSRYPDGLQEHEVNPYPMESVYFVPLGYGGLHLSHIDRIVQE